MRRLKLTKSPYYHLLGEDDNFRRWVESLERGLIMTATGISGGPKGGFESD